MSTSIITHRSFKRDMRFDAEYYRPEYLEIEEKLGKLKSTVLKNLIDKLTNGVEVRDFVEHGIPYIRVSNTNKPFFIDFSDIAFIREASEKKLSKDVSLNEEDLLTNRSGTLGFSQIITPDFKKAVISSHNIRITGIKINSYFLVTFLNSKYGKLQILRRNNGGVVPEINQPALKSILIYVPPIDFQKKIETQVKESYQLLQKSQNKLKEAEEILNKELDLNEVKTANKNVTVISYKDFISELRFDSQYFSSLNLNSIFTGKFNTKPLKELCENIDTGLTPSRDSYWHKGYPVLKMGCLTNFGINWSKIEFANETYFKKAKKFMVNENDIFLTSSAHALEHIAKKVNIISEIPKEYQNKLVFVGEVLRLKIKEEQINPYYLQLFLKTEIGYKLLQNCIRGQTAHIYPKDVKNIEIPLISEKKQNEIEMLLKESENYRNLSSELIKDSIKEVEDLIDNIENNSKNSYI